MTKAEKFIFLLASEIPNVKEGKMFGAFCMKTPNGKSAAMLWKDNIVVKLSKEPLKEALSLEGTKLFEPMAGKPMKDWVQIPFSHKDKWKIFASTSVASIQALKTKVSVKKKSKVRNRKHECATNRVGNRLAEGITISYKSLSAAVPAEEYNQL